MGHCAVAGKCHAHDLANCGVADVLDLAEAETLDPGTHPGNVSGDPSMTKVKSELLVMIGAVQRGDDGTFTVRQSAPTRDQPFIKWIWLMGYLGTANQNPGSAYRSDGRRISPGCGLRLMRSAGEHSLDRSVSLLTRPAAAALHAIAGRQIHRGHRDKAIQERVAELTYPADPMHHDAHTADAHAGRMTSATMSAAERTELATAVRGPAQPALRHGPTCGESEHTGDGI